MQHNQSVSRYKQKLLIFLSALFIALTLQPKQTVYADPVSEASDRIAGMIVNSTHSDTEGGTTTIKNGVLPTRTGYMCYLLTKDGAKVSGTDAYAFSSPSFANVPSERTPEWCAQSRKGGYSVSDWNGGEAPWGLCPWEGNGSPSNEPGIKEWFLSNNESGKPRGIAFVEFYFGEEAAVNFSNDEYILVIETLMHFQYSVSDPSASADMQAYAEELFNKQFPTPTKLLVELMKDEIFKNYYNNLPDGAKESTLTSIVASTITKIKNQLIADGFDAGTGRTFVGPPLIGTVPGLLNQKQALGITKNPFSSFTNAAACMNEKILVSEAGFIACPIIASKTNQLTDAEVQQYGVAMIIIHCTDPAQTTCDEPLAGTPHNPPKESQGHTTIVKSYRTKDPTGALIDDGTFHLKDLGTQILIENEQTYQVIGWKTSTTTNTNIKSTSWNPPSSVVQQGTTPKSVTLQPTETCLYVLLEKVEEEEVEPLDWNYRLSESSITRTVWFSNPDRPLSNMNNPEWIYQHKFNWASPATPYCDGHPYKGACTGLHEGEHTSSCPKGCPSTCDLPSTHIHEKACDSHHYWNCGSDDCPLNNLQYSLF